VSQAIGDAARHFPRLDPSPLDTTGLEPRDARLAQAIHRAVLQRWLTLEQIINHFSKQSIREMQPEMRGVLLTAAAQLVLFDRLPAHAVVDESVDLARRLVRRKAAGLANAVLRRVAGAIEASEPAGKWIPAQQIIPMEQGFVRFNEPILPEPSAREQHLSVATSHHVQLVHALMEQLGHGPAFQVCLAGLRHPSTIVFAERGGDGSNHESLRSHDGAAGAMLWDGGHDELVAWLNEHPARRVQDPAAAMPVKATSDLSPSLIVDFCAGRGTKSVQLATMHPEAKIIATDPDPARYASLREVAARRPNMIAVRPDSVIDACGGPGRADLLLLDVPCSNTAVLARRPEAKYRFSSSNTESLVTLQRDIAQAAMPLLADGGHLLYATCSLLREENGEQSDWLAERFDMQLVRTELTLPDGAGRAYHDGSFFSLLRRT